MLVNFFITGKRKNSTYKPTAADMETGVQLNCKLKDFCSFLNPVLEIQTERQIADYNYFYIPEFDRYYWVDDVSWQRGFVAVSGHVDPMASFSQTIKANSAYILRAAADFDGKIIDNYYPVKAEPILTRSYIGEGFETYGYNPASGTYIVGVVGGSSNENSVTYYAISPGGFNALMIYLFSDEIFPDTMDELTTDIMKSVANPFKYFVSCIWFPFTAGISGSASTVQVGFIDTKIQATRLAIDKHIAVHDNLRIPHHPMAAERGEYLNHEPYTKCTLYFPPVGIIPIDTTYIGPDGVANVVLDVDLMCGNCLCTIYAGADTGSPIGQRAGMIGVPVELAGNTRNYVGAISSVIGGVASAAQGNILGAVSGVGSALESLVPQVMTAGANGSRVGITNTYIAVTSHFIPVDDDPAHIGRPLCTAGALGNYPGYVKCEGFHLSGSNATDSERMIIEGYFNGEGAFIE